MLAERQVLLVKSNFFSRGWFQRKSKGSHGFTPQKWTRLSGVQIGYLICFFFISNLISNPQNIPIKILSHFMQLLLLFYQFWCFLILFPAFWTEFHFLIELDDGKIYRNPLYLMVKTMVSCNFSLKPIQGFSPFFSPYLLDSSWFHGHDMPWPQGYPWCFPMAKTRRSWAVPCPQRLAPYPWPQVSRGRGFKVTKLGLKKGDPPDNKWIYNGILVGHTYMCVCIYI